MLISKIDENYLRYFVQHDGTANKTTTMEQRHTYDHKYGIIIGYNWHLIAVTLPTIENRAITERHLTTLLTWQVDKSNDWQTDGGSYVFSLTTIVYIWVSIGIGQRYESLADWLWSWANQSSLYRLPVVLSLKSLTFSHIEYIPIYGNDWW